VKILLYLSHTCGFKDSILDVFPYPDNIDCLLESMPIEDQFIYARSNGFDIMAYSWGGMADLTADRYDKCFSSYGILPVYAHCGNSHTRTTATTRLHAIILVGHGNGTETTDGSINPNSGSYGPGLEFYAWKSSESACTPYVAAMFARLMTDHPDWNFWDARAALRQTAWNYTRGGWVEDGGFGLLDWEAANTLSDSDLALFGPVNLQAEVDEKKGVINLTWVNFESSQWHETLFVLFDHEPARDEDPADGRIIYAGPDTGATCPFHEWGGYWLAAYSRDAQGGLSLLEACDTRELMLRNFSGYDTPQYEFIAQRRPKVFDITPRQKIFASQKGSALDM